MIIGFSEDNPRQLAPTVGTKQVGATISAVPAIINSTTTSTIDELDFGSTRFKLGSLQSRLLQQVHQDLRQAHGEHKKIFERVTRRSTSTKALTRSLQDRKTYVLRALAAMTRSTSRRSLRWKDVKSSFRKSVKISANSNGWISIGDSCTEALSESEGTPRDSSTNIPEISSDINLKIPPVKACGFQSPISTNNIRKFQ